VSMRTICHSNRSVEKLRSWFCVIILCLVFSIEESTGSPSDSLTMLITGGLRGKLNECACPSAKRGGIARRATLMRQLFQNNQPLGVDCGQLLDLDPEGGRMRSACAILSLGRLGTEVSLVATRDLFYGVDFIKDVADSADIDLVCANIIDGSTGKTIFPKWIELEYRDVTLAFTGLTQHFPHKRIPGMDSWMTAPIDSALKYIKASIPSNAERIILLTDMSESELNELIPTFPELDIVFTSSRRVYTPSPIVVNSTLIVRPQPDGSFLEGIVIPISEKTTTSNRFITHPLNASIASDIEFEGWLENCQKRQFTFK